MSFWINSFKTPLFNHAIINNDSELLTALSRFSKEIKIIIHVDNCWDYGIVVCRNDKAMGTASIKYAKNLRRNKFIDNVDIGKIPSFTCGNFLFPTLGKELGKDFVLLGYFDPDSNFYPVEIYDLNDGGRRIYMNVSDTLLTTLRLQGFIVPTRVKLIREWVRNIPDSISALQPNTSILIIPAAEQDQAILFKK